MPTYTLDRFENIFVYLAVQVFSQSVATAMDTYWSMSKLPINSKWTIKFIEKMDKLFDLFNSSKVPNGKDFRRPFKNTSSQREHLLKMVSFFKKLRVAAKGNESDITNRINFING